MPIFDYRPHPSGHRNANSLLRAWGVWTSNFEPQASLWLSDDWGTKTARKPPFRRRKVGSSQAVSLDNDPFGRLR